MIVEQGWRPGVHVGARADQQQQHGQERFKIE
jgi:hypothetical protein